MGCSSEYKTVLRYPEFRKRFHRQILEGPVRKRDASSLVKNLTGSSRILADLQRPVKDPQG